MFDVDKIRQALEAAKGCIEQDRASLADSSMRPDNTMDPEAAAGVAEYDGVLASIQQAFVELAQFPLLRTQLDGARSQRDHARALADGCIKLLSSIHGLLYPSPLTTPDGRVLVFRPSDPDPHTVLQELSERIRALPVELAALAAQADHILIPRSELVERDSYDVHGSDFSRCKLCGGESGAGVLNSGIKHDPTCYLAAAPTAQPQVDEPMTRFCPGCGSVGPVPNTYRDCCPDGGRARIIPESLAVRCRDLFQAALVAAMSQQQEDANALRTKVARAIWHLLREHDDKEDLELEDMQLVHPVWSYADAAIKAMARPNETQAHDGFVLVPTQHPRSVQWVLESIEASNYTSYQDAWRDLLIAAGAEVPATATEATEATPASQPQTTPAEPAQSTTCVTCDGHGLIGGHTPDGSGHGEPCPECNSEPAQPVELPDMTGQQIEDIAIAGSYYNAAGGIYATSVHDFALAVAEARDEQWRAALASVRGV